jgi:hypothetical protein
MRAGLVQINTVQINTEPLWHRQLVWCDWRDKRGDLRPLRGGGISAARQTGSLTPMR